MYHNVNSYDEGTPNNEQMDELVSKLKVTAAIADQDQGVFEGAAIPPEHDIYSQLVFGQIDLNQRPLPRDVSEQVDTSVTVNDGRDREERDSFDVDITELTRPLERSQNNAMVQDNTFLSDMEASSSSNAPDLLSQLKTPGNNQTPCKPKEPPKAGFDILFDLNESLSADDLALQQTEMSEVKEAKTNSNANTAEDETRVPSRKRVKRNRESTAARAVRPRRKCSKRVWDGTQFVAKEFCEEAIESKKRRED